MFSNTYSIYFKDQNVTFKVIFVILEYDSSTINIKWKRVGRKLLKRSPSGLAKSQADAPGLSCVPVGLPKCITALPDGLT